MTILIEEIPLDACQEKNVARYLKQLRHHYSPVLHAHFNFPDWNEILSFTELLSLIPIAFLSLKDLHKLRFYHLNLAA